MVESVFSIISAYSIMLIYLWYTNEYIKEHIQPCKSNTLCMLFPVDIKILVYTSPAIFLALKPIFSFMLSENIKRIYPVWLFEFFLTFALCFIVKDLVHLTYILFYLLPIIFVIPDRVYLIVVNGQEGSNLMHSSSSRRYILTVLSFLSWCWIFTYFFRPYSFI